jgi:hypothetical protein
VHRRRSPQLRLAAALVIAAAAVTGCTGSTSSGSTGTVPVTVAPPASSTTATRTTASTPLTPVTTAGLQTGPGVTDGQIALGVVTDPARDRGFTQGAQLWERSVNTSGGICGRTVALRTSSTASPAAGYEAMARSVAGFLAVPTTGDSDGLGARARADGITVLGGSGSSTALDSGIVPLGATDDVKAINALAYLQGKKKIPSGATIGFLTDDAGDTQNALTGARWWAQRNDVTLVTADSPDADWSGMPVVLAPTDSARVTQLLARVPADTVVVTDVDGYDPSSWTASDQGRLLVELITPALGSDHPAAAAVAKAYAADDPDADPGPRLLAGFAVAAGWGRVLAQACTASALTRTGIAAAVRAVGPASVDSLLGPSDPAEVVDRRMPATRVSSLAQADPTAPGGLRPLMWLQAADGIAGYHP